MPFETRVTARGQAYSQWVKPVPQIPPSILNSIVFLYSDLISAETGVDEGGSGFLLVFPSEGCLGAYHYYAVTNAHVIEEGHPVVRINLKYPSTGNKRTECFEFPHDAWIVHEKHDLAVCPLPCDLDNSLFNITLLHIEQLVTHDMFKELDIREGDDLFYVGRFMGHAGKSQNLPSVRFGNVSMLPNDEEPIEYETKKRKRSQVGFLAEARSRSGYSGSPVFFYEQHAIQNKRLILDFDLRLLGVDWGHIPETVPIVDRNGHLHGDKWCINVHAGMMGVVPAWYLADFLRTSQELINQRARDDEYYLAHPPKGAPDNV